MRFIVVIISLIAAPVAAQVSWTLAGTVDSGVPVAGSTPVAELDAGPLRIAYALTPEVAQDAFMAGGWPTGAVDPCRYLEFSVLVAGGHGFDYTTLDFELAPTPGSCDWEIRSEQDGFASVVDAGSVVDLATAGAITAQLSAMGTRAGRRRIRLYLFNNVGGAAPGRRGLLGSAGGGADPVVTGPVTASNAPQIAHWDLEGTIDSAIPFPVTTNDPAVAPGPITAAPTMSTWTEDGEFFVRGFPTVNAPNLAKYIEFSIAPRYGKQITLHRLSFTTAFDWSVIQTRRKWQLRSSVDGFTSSLAQALIDQTSDPFQFVVDVSAVGTRTDAVAFRLYYYFGHGLDPSGAGLRSYNVPIVPIDGGLRMYGIVQDVLPGYPGTDDDLLTEFAVGAAPALRPSLPVAVAPGETVSVTHGSPGGTEVLGGEVVILVSTTATGQAFPSLFPGLWLEPTTAAVLLDASVLGFPVLLPPQGLSYSFAAPTALAGTSGLLQCFVLDPTTCNGLFASTTGLELVFQ